MTELEQAREHVNAAIDEAISAVRCDSSAPHSARFVAGALDKLVAAALKQYGTHDLTCPKSWLSESPEEDCNCGFDALLEEP